MPDSRLHTVIPGGLACSMMPNSMCCQFQWKCEVPSFDMKRGLGNVLEYANLVSWPIVVKGD